VWTDRNVTYSCDHDSFGVGLGARHNETRTADDATDSGLVLSTL